MSRVKQWVNGDVSQRPILVNGPLRNVPIDPNGPLRNVPIDPLFHSSAGACSSIFRATPRASPISAIKSSTDVPP